MEHVSVYPLRKESPNPGLKIRNLLILSAVFILSASVSYKHVEVNKLKSFPHGSYDKTLVKDTIQVQKAVDLRTKEKHPLAT